MRFWIEPSISFGPVHPCRDWIVADQTVYASRLARRCRVPEAHVLSVMPILGIDPFRIRVPTILVIPR